MARPTTEPQSGRASRSPAAAPPLSHSRRTSAVRKRPAGLGATRGHWTPTHRWACFEPTRWRGVQAVPAGRCGNGDWDAPRPQSPGFVESHFYSVYIQPFRKTEPLCVCTGRDLRDKLAQTACFTDGNPSNQRGARVQGHSHFPSRISTGTPPGLWPVLLQAPAAC